MPVQTELEMFIASSKKLRPRTKHLYMLGVSSFLDFAGRTPNKWSKKAVESWVADLNNSVKPQTVNINLHALRYATKRYANRHSDPKLDFASDVTALVCEPPKVRKPLKPEQRQSLLKACEGTRPIDLRDYALCVLGLRTGIRRSSMCSVEITDLDGNKLALTLKGDRKHSIELDDETMRALRPWLDYLNNNGIHDGPIFRSLSKPHRNGDVTVRGKMSPDGLFRALLSRARAAGIRDFYPHVFYHTFMARVKEEGWSDEKIRAVTGRRTR